MGGFSGTNQTALVLWWGHLSRVHVSEEVAAESLFCSTALTGVQSQHVIKQVQGRQRNTKRSKKNLV